MNKWGKEERLRKQIMTNMKLTAYSEKSMLPFDVRGN